MSTRTWNQLERADGRPLIAASILSADFAHMGESCAAVLQAGADLLHLDVMDGHFVPNLTMGPDLCKAVHRAVPGAFLDVHLMVTNPARFIEPFAKAGANSLTIHVEAHDDLRAAIRAIRQLGLGVGMAINPPTPFERIEPWIEQLDLVLVMSVNPGFSGQAFIPAVLEKVKAVRGRMRGSQRLQMDGGINPATAQACIAAGCDTIVAASAIFGSADRASAIAALRSRDARPAAV